MKSQDFMSQDNERAEAIRKITAFCDRHGYSYRYVQKTFAIDLPQPEPLPSPIDRPRRKQADVTGLEFLLPDSNGYNEEDQLPPTTEPLTEGEPPKEEN